MKCFKRNQCKGKPMVCPQKGSIPIKVSIFLVAALIMLSMATVVIAQSKTVPQSPLTTLEEDRILKECRFAAPKFDPDVSKEFYTDLEHYMRDGCKKALSGEWRWDTWGDIITITYNEQYKVFLGNVTRPVKMDLKPGHLLFKVYFHKNMSAVGFILDCYDINSLRSLRDCPFETFAGTEFAFEQKTRKPTVMNLLLILDGDRIEYKVEKDAYYLRRIK